MWYQACVWKKDGLPVTEADWALIGDEPLPRWGILIDVPEMLAQLDYLETYTTSDGQEYVTIRILLYNPHRSIEGSYFEILSNTDQSVTPASRSLIHVYNENPNLNSLGYSLSSAPCLGYVRLTSHFNPDYPLTWGGHSGVPLFREEEFHEEEYSNLKISLNLAGLTEYYQNVGQPSVIFVSAQMYSLQRVLLGERSVGILKGGLISFSPLGGYATLNYPRGIM